VFHCGVLLDENELRIGKKYPTIHVSTVHEHDALVVANRFVCHSEREAIVGKRARIFILESQVLT
jgi:hypothetical protein